MYCYARTLCSATKMRAQMPQSPCINMNERHMCWFCRMVFLGQPDHWLMWRFDKGEIAIASSTLRQGQTSTLAQVQSPA